MNILFLTDNFPPETNAPAARTFEHARVWASSGHRVSLITGAPNFPQGKLLNGYSNAWRQREAMDGIDVIRVWTFISANEGFFRRVLDHLSFAFSAFLAGLSQQADVIVATSPQFFTTFAAFALSKVKRRPWVFEVRDLWPATIAAIGAIKHEGILRVLERIELALYRDATMVIVVTESFRDDLIARGIDPKKIRVITNGVDLASFAPRPKDTSLVDDLDLADKTVIGYIGTHGSCQGLEFIVDAAASVDDPSLHFLFVGAGVDRQAVIDRATELQLSNVTFLESVPKDEVPRYIATSDIILVPLRKAELFSSVIPSKIFEAAGMERPMLIGVDGEARALVEHFNAGRFYEPEDLHSFLEALSKIRTADHQKMAAGCKSLANHYDRTRLAGEMMSLLVEVSAK